MSSIANKNTHVVPFWGKESNLKVGLNQLGIRNVAEQMFATLLPGLNNVSARIRYYSFYCWLLSMFYKGKKDVDKKTFVTYIRKSELLSALIHAANNQISAGIPGIQYAQDNYPKENALYNLQLGIYNKDGSTSHTYWAMSGGVFRQYYSASLVELSLIASNEKDSAIYNVRKDNGFINGDCLANEFQKSVGCDGEIFLSIVNKGVVSQEELEKLVNSFKMKLFEDESTERNLLLEMLLQCDHPTSEDRTYFRKTTIKYILQYLYESQPESLTSQGFARYIYELYLNKTKTDDTCWGWYAYYLDDNWQYQLTIIFQEMLQLTDVTWKPIDEVVSQLTDRIMEDFSVSQDCSVKS
ncbi:MAG: hypothetical protein IKK40_03800, partial [Bacteroidales bacterium]|nr:hypothetical protein [Bacteroidales bacterium]